MLPLNRHKVVIPNSLAAIAAICCLALAWSGFGVDFSDSSHNEQAAASQVEAEHVAERSSEQQDAERTQRAEQVHSYHLADFTFFLLPNRTSG